MRDRLSLFKGLVNLKGNTRTFSNVSENCSYACWEKIISDSVKKIEFDY